MIEGEHSTMPPEWRIAVAYTPAALRHEVSTFGALDQRLARIVAQASEPILVQMRLAWWRDELKKPADERPQGDAVLDAIARDWSGYETFLSALVDGWEQVLAEPPLSQQAALGFAAGRTAPFLGLCQKHHISVDPDRVLQAARRWALTDLGAHVSSEQEREKLISLARADGAGAPAMPRALRGLAIFEALALRSMKRGGRPLMEGRGAGLTAFKVGLLGQ